MTFAGFIKRLILVALLTWIISSFTLEFVVATYVALLPVIYYEMLRSR